MFDNGELLERNIFISEVVNPLKSTFKLSEPHQIPEYYLTKIPQLFDLNLIDEVFDIFSNSFAVVSTSVQEKAIDSLQLVLSNVDINRIQTIIAPQLFNVLSKTAIASVGTSVLLCFSKFVHQLREDFVSDKLLPLIIKQWKQHDWDGAADPICSILEKGTINSSAKVTIGIPVASMVLANSNVKKNVQARLFNWINLAIQNARFEKGIPGKKRRLLEIQPEAIPIPTPVAQKPFQPIQPSPPSQSPTFNDPFQPTKQTTFNDPFQPTKSPGFNDPFQPTKSPGFNPSNPFA